MSSCVFHLCTWNDLINYTYGLVYSGSEKSRISGFLHASTWETLEESAYRHMPQCKNLYVLVLECNGLGSQIRWERVPARNNILFPHIYGDIPLKYIVSAVPVPLGCKGHYIFPDLTPFLDRAI